MELKYKMENVVLVKPGDRSTNTAQTIGMTRQGAITPDLCSSRGLWMGFVSAPPGSSGIHHHEDAESGIYVLKGRIKVHFGDTLDSSVIAETGDFLYIPPFAPHVEENLSSSEPAELIVARNSAEYLVTNLPDLPK